MLFSWDENGKYVAGTANMVNCLVDPGVALYMQDPGNAQFRQAVVSQIGAATFKNAWSVYHCSLGELHCGSHAKRTLRLSRPWWEEVHTWLWYD